MRKLDEDGQTAGAACRNEVLLVGKLSAEPVSRVLPSGDACMSWRLIVSRAGATASGGNRVVDTIDCVTFARTVQRAALRWQPGDIFEMNGSLRRRFWRGPHGVSSRTEVEVRSVRRAKSV